jgi:hypothetical protein
VTPTEKSLVETYRALVGYDERWTLSIRVTAMGAQVSYVAGDKSDQVAAPSLADSLKALNLPFYDQPEGGAA